MASVPCLVIIRQADFKELVSSKIKTVEKEE